MSTATIHAGHDDLGEFEFAAIVAAYDLDTPVRRSSRAAERREAREQIDLQLGIVRHRTHEREV